MARIEQGEKARKEVAKPSNPKLRLRTRLMETVLSAAAIVAACAPLPVAAQDTTPKKEVAAAVEKEKTGVTYETIADLSELQPYLDNAKDKLFTIKKGETKQVGPYKIEVDKEADEYYTHYSITTEDGKRDGITIPSKNENINKLLLDMGDSHPYIKGKMLVFADNQEVRFMYFNKKKNEYRKAVVSLGDGRMRPGPVQTGIDVTAESIAVISFPKNTKAGDVITQAELASTTNENYTLGSGYRSFFVYAPDKPAGTLIASIAMNY